MRITALAGLVLFASLGGAALAAATADNGWQVSPPGNSRYSFETGSGVTAGMRANQADYLRSAGFNGPCCSNAGFMERKFPLAALRGKRARLAFRIKQEGAARTFAAFTLHNADNTDVIFPPQAQEPGWKGWDQYEIVMDVPANADDLTLALTLRVAKGRATSWVDDVRLEAVDRQVPVTGGTHTIEHHALSDSWLNSTY